MFFIFFFIFHAIRQLILAMSGMKEKSDDSFQIAGNDQQMTRSFESGISHLPVRTTANGTDIFRLKSF